MSIGKAAQTYNAINNISRQREIIRFAKEHAGKQGEIVAKEYKRFNIITLLIIFLVMIPLIWYTIFSFDDLIGQKYPPGATQEKYGRVSLYYDNFWYTENDQIYKFDFSDLNIENDFEPGENIVIFLDDNNNLVSVAHENDGFGVVVRVVLMFAIPIILLLGHAIIGRNIYAKNYTNFCKWYELVVEPHKNTSEYKNVVANAEYQDVDKLLATLDEDSLKKLKMYKRINMILTLSFLVVLALVIYIYIKLDMQPYSLPSILFMFIYVTIFMIPISIMDSKIKDIKQKTLKK